MTSWWLTRGELGLNAFVWHGTEPSCNSHESDRQVNRIYEKLTRTFGNPSATNDEIDRALKSMELIAPLSSGGVSQKSYNLFHIVMQAPTSITYTQKKKWEASRLAMHGAYKLDQSLPWVGDPHDVLAFLDHHFDLATAKGGQNQDEPIQNALRALAYASDPVTIDHLSHFDSAKPSFVHGLCHAFKNGKPSQLRRAAFFFLPLIGDKWFNAPRPIMKPEQMKSLCADWASTVDAIEDSDDVQRAALAVLLGMINSRDWRPHIATEKWDLLKDFISLPDDSQPLKRCVDNPELTNAIRSVANPAAIVHWLKILWMKYKELIPEVRRQLETVTREVSQGRRRLDLEEYLKVIESKLKEAEDALTQYSTWATDPPAVALRAKIENLQQAKGALTTIKRG